jgi:hypothetical protein
MLEPESVQAALLAAAGEVQALMNHLGLAARSAPATKLAFGADLRAFLRKALQFGRAELVSTETGLASAGPLAAPVDVVVAAKSRVPQLAIQVQWHARGEDHAGFATAAMSDIVHMIQARTKGAVEQAAVLVGAPSRFWRWLPGFAEDRDGYGLLAPEPDTPASFKAGFLAAPAWDHLFQEGLERELPERLWTSVLAEADVRSPWAETELRLLEVKGLGNPKAVR